MPVSCWAPFMWSFRDKGSFCSMVFLSSRSLYSFPFNGRLMKENGGQYVGDFYGLGLEMQHCVCLHSIDKTQSHTQLIAKEKRKKIRTSSRSVAKLLYQKCRNLFKMSDSIYCFYYLSISRNK